MTPKAKVKTESRTRPKAERREQILLAARAVFAERGYHAASVSQIVARCGLAQGTFYLYFKSKREVFEALLDAFTAEIFLAFFLPGADAVQTQAEVRERFRAVSRSALAVLDANRDLARILLLEAPAREPGFESKISQFYDRLIRAAAANLAVWMERGLLRPADPMVIAHCVVGMIERLLRQKLAAALSGDFAAMVEETVTFELYGILRDPAAVFGKTKTRK